MFNSFFNKGCILEIASSIVLIGHNKHEPNRLRSFWDLFAAGTIKNAPPDIKTRLGVFMLGGDVSY